jgi:16S rRNA (cytosine967-C5)-methyltransferase
VKKSIRHRAVDILSEVGKSRAFAGDLLDAALEERHLSGTADGRLLTHLVYGVLRMRGRLDWILAAFYRGDYEKTDEDVRNILRVGLYQLLFSDRLPAFAVVDEAVKTAKRKNPAAGGLVNAVLRSYLRDPGRVSYPCRETDPQEYLAAFHSHPLWLVKLWRDAFGMEETEALCRADNEVPSVTLRANTLRISRNDLAQKLARSDFPGEPGRFSPDAIILSDPPRPVQKTDFFAEGLFRLQDEAAQLAAYLVGPQPGETVLDACAGSGGKTTHLAALMENRGRIVAMDRDANKIDRLRKDARRLGVSIAETVAADLAKPLSSEWREKFDRILVDAPCSGTGTLRRNPDIKWRLAGTDPDLLAEIQLAILHNAQAAVRRGGCLVYCTCSLLACENDGVIRRFLKDHPQFSVKPPSASIPQVLQDSRGFFRTYPHRHAQDGFFGAALLRRI